MGNECALNEIKLKLSDKDKIIKSSDDEIKVLKNDNNKKEDEIKSLQLEISNLKTNKSDLDQNFAKLDKDFKLKEDKLENLQKQSREELDSKENELKNNKDKYEEQLNSLNKELADLKASNEELQINLTSANENVKTSTNLLEKKEKALKISTDLLQKCQDEIEKKTSELDTNKKSLMELEENYRESAVKVHGFGAWSLGWQLSLSNDHTRRRLKVGGAFVMPCSPQCSNRQQDADLVDGVHCVRSPVLSCPPTAFAGSRKTKAAPH